VILEPQIFSPKNAKFSDWQIDFIKRLLMDSQGNEIRLTSQEFRLLEALVLAAPQKLSRARLLEVLVGRYYEAETRSVDVIIAKIRKKIEQDRDNPRLILTIRGMGYQLASDVLFDGVAETLPAL